MLLKIIKLLGWVGVLASGPVFALGGYHAAGYLLALFGSLAYWGADSFQTLKRTLAYLDDRHQAHMRLIDSGDHSWVIDRMVMIAERDSLGKKLETSTKELQSRARTPVESEPDDPRYS